jgi:hypothetical protein
MSGRELLISDAIAYLQTRFREALDEACPGDWDQERREKLQDDQLAQSQRILEALELRQLGCYTSLVRHADGACLELRQTVHHEIAVERARGVRG